MKKLSLLAIAILIATIHTASATQYYWSPNGGMIDTQFGFAGDVGNSIWGNWNTSGDTSRAYLAPAKSGDNARINWATASIYLEDDYTFNAVDGVTISLGLAALTINTNISSDTNYEGDTYISAADGKKLTLITADSSWMGRLALIAGGTRNIFFTSEVVVRSATDVFTTIVYQGSSTASLNFDKLTIMDALDGSAGRAEFSTHNSVNTGWVYIDKLLGDSRQILQIGGVQTVGQEASVTINSTADYYGTIQVRGGILRLDANPNPAMTLIVGVSNGNPHGGRLFLGPGFEMTHPITMQKSWGGLVEIGIVESGTVTLSSTLAQDGDPFAFVASEPDSKLIVKSNITGNVHIAMRGKGTIELQTNINNMSGGYICLGAKYVYYSGTGGGWKMNAAYEATKLVGATFNIARPVALYGFGGFSNKTAPNFNGGINFFNVDREFGQYAFTLGDGFGSISAKFLQDADPLIPYDTTTPVTRPSTFLFTGDHFTFTLGADFDPEVLSVYTLFTTADGITLTNGINSTWFPLNALYNGQLEIVGKNLVLNVAAIPEPATWALLGASLLVVTLFRRKKI